MITLIFDAVIAAIKLVDRGCAAVEQNVRHRATPQPVADAQPAGAGVSLPASATGTGGHPDLPTSWLLEQAEDLLGYGDQNNTVRTVRAQLRDRAAYFRAVVND